MELLSCNNASIRLFVIFLLGSCFKVSNAKEEYNTATTDQDLTNPEITILQGPIRGVTLSTQNNRSIAGFQGLPYAQPPIGNLRFKASVPADGWSETFDAQSDSPDCPQLSGNVVVGNEDCLYLNVYTPRLPTNESSQLLPVMVFIHGGAFGVGSNNLTSAGPGYLLDKDVVFVVPSYRLAALGFLSTGDVEAPGNWGLKDQVLALKWIQDNIEFFGGDPNQVTILGQSAGSMAVGYLVLSNSTNGLFNRYITQSSSAFSKLAYQPRAYATDYAFRLGKYLGCLNDTSALLIECLRSVDVTQILDTASLFLAWEIFPLVSWAPTDEPDLEGAVLTSNPADLLATGKVGDRLQMIGSVREDGLVLSGYFYAYPDKFEEFLADFDEILPYVLNYYDKVKNVSAYTSALKSYYFNNDLTSDRSLILSNLTQLCNDIVVNCPQYEELQRAPSNPPQYLYSFEYHGSRSFSYYYTYGSTTNHGVAHGDELFYLFPQAETLFVAFNTTLSASDKQIIETMVELWTSFAINGKPESTALTSNESWPAFSEDMKLLRIGNEACESIEVESYKSRDRMQFLSNLNARYT